MSPRVYPSVARVRTLNGMRLAHRPPGLSLSGQHQPRDKEIERETHGAHHNTEGHTYPEVARFRIASERSSAFQRHDPGLEAVKANSQGTQDEELERTDEELPQEARSNLQAPIATGTSAPMTSQTRCETPMRFRTTDEQ